MKRAARVSEALRGPPSTKQYVGAYAGRSIAANHDAERVSCQTDDVGKIRGGIERSLGHERLPENGPGKLRDRVAIRFRLSKKREGTTFVVHVECKGPGGRKMLGDVIFTPREDKIIDFSDLDQTYKAVLH